MAIHPHSATEMLCKQVSPVAIDCLATSDFQVACGRVLAEVLTLDRDSPSCDVSAMDGYAVRIDEILASSLSIVGECPIGQPPTVLERATARRIYTGGPIPTGADTVIRLERGDEKEGMLSPQSEVVIQAGADIRRRGENAVAGKPVLFAGTQLTAAAIGVLASIGPQAISTYKRLRVSVITTGNELDRGLSSMTAWRLRDSNGPALLGLLHPLPWIESVEWVHANDELRDLTDTIINELSRSDAVVLTGGVSKGAYDFVPEAVQKSGGSTVFHRIAARPGQPTLGAVFEGKPILGLPGNPLAVLCGGRRLLMPALRKRAGFAVADPSVPVVQLSQPPGKTLPITWWRPVKLIENGIATIAKLKGSGDVIGPAETDGFIEVPPESTGVGPYPYYTWQP